jgi:hypothetical protein
MKDKIQKFVYKLIKNLEHGEGCLREETYLEYKGHEIYSFYDEKEMFDKGTFTKGNRLLLNDIESFIKNLNPNN